MLNLVSTASNTFFGVLKKLLACFFQTEIDFSRKTASGTNGLNQLAQCDKSAQLKKSPGEYKSVTGDFLEEVVSLINLKGTDDSTPLVNK